MGRVVGRCSSETPERLCLVGNRKLEMRFRIGSGVNRERNIAGIGNVDVGSDEARFAEFPRWSYRFAAGFQCKAVAPDAGDCA